MGVEPMTLRLKGECSTTELRTHKNREEMPLYKIGKRGCAIMTAISGGTPFAPID
jgi:hypothetical protein